MLVLFTQLQDQVGRNLKLSVGEPLRITTRYSLGLYYLFLLHLNAEREGGNKAMCDFSGSDFGFTFVTFIE